MYSSCTRVRVRVTSTTSLLLILTKLPCARDPNSRDRDRDAQPRDRDETLEGLETVSRRDIRDVTTALVRATNFFYTCLDT
jgi:hypothetical protein